ncbi:haloacid dehalogenase [Elizabethkingia meningoseptica]|uniref:HAD family hydrolase n=1 Tax=Elizabethkingia meningoseptica TaxID=238 RepID=UPI0009997F37|nr:HAD family hydrolase [Elizabethkingia meningoseptica]OPB97070.1 haloacid dehalogenase [Elizabethkingia meningoseptica]
MKAKYIIFDLDDTLIYEIDYLRSAYKNIAEILDKTNSEILFQRMLMLYNTQENVFDRLIEDYPEYSISNLLDMYRNHFPNIRLNDGGKEILTYCKVNNYKLGLITDGRSITQRNKLKALGIENFFDKIIISEEFGSSKPNERNFKDFCTTKDIDEYFYIADNPKKDFITPNKLDWCTICLLDKGENIHPQDFSLSQEYLPKFRVKELIELKELINNINSRV